MQRNFMIRRSEGPQNRKTARISETFTSKSSRKKVIGNLADLRFCGVGHD